MLLARITRQRRKRSALAAAPSLEAPMPAADGRRPDPSALSVSGRISPARAAAAAVSLLRWLDLMDEDARQSEVGMAACPAPSCHRGGRPSDRRRAVPIH